MRILFERFKMDESFVECLFGFKPEEISQTEKTTILFHDNLSLLTQTSPCFFEVFYDGESCDLLAFASLCENFFFQKFTYCVHPNMGIKETNKVRMWIEKCQQIQWQSHCEASDFQDFGIKAFSNLCQGLHREFDGTSFHHMQGCCQGIPAVICGAGPSLKNSIPFLQEQDNRGLVFAGGAALGSLTRLGVQIHVATGVDPDPSYERDLIQGSCEVPFFYPSRCQPSLVDVMQGPLFQVPSNPGYSLASWIEESIFFDGGWTAATFSTALAVHLGCNPILFVGVDLSCPPDKVPQEEGFFWEDSEKGTLWTKKDWVLSARWIEGLVGKHPEVKFCQIAGGITLAGVQQVSWEAMSSQYDCQGLVQMLSSFWTKSNVLNTKIEIVQASLEKSYACVQALLDLYEQNYPKNPEEKGLFVLALFDLEEELFYQKVLAPIWRFWRFSIERNLMDAYARGLNRLLFFKNVLQQYRICLCQKSCLK